MQPPITVWIIEDDSNYRQTLNQALDFTDGLDCTETFSSCEAAMNWLQIAPADQAPDVILLDINLPGVSGIEGISQLKAKSPQTHIIMLTIIDDQNTIFDALRSGASGYLLKNSELDDIIGAIEAAAKGGTFMPPEVANKVLALFRGLGPKTDYGLTKREKEVLGYMTQGLMQKQIAETLFVAPNTVNTHVQHIYQKLHVHSNVEAVAKALREWLV